MFFNYINKNKKWFSINIIGIAIAFAAVLIVFSYTQKELSFDNFHSKADNIYRIQIDKPGRANILDETDDISSASIDRNYIVSLYDRFPSIKKIAFIGNLWQAKIQVGKNEFSPENIYYTNETFFEVFDFKVEKGNRNTLLKKPDEVAISAATALNYFGSIDVIGKEITLKEPYTEDKTFTITAILENAPTNSHFRPEILLSRSLKEMKENYGGYYTYLLLPEKTSPSELLNSINDYWSKNVKEEELAPSFKLLPLKDIHLKSHQRDELSETGNINSLIILIAGAIIILLIVIINYSNLNFVQFINNSKDFKIRMVNGASILNLSQLLFVRSIAQSIIAIGIGAFLACNFNQATHFEYQLEIAYSTVLISSLLFLIAFGILALLPLYIADLSTDLSKTPNHGSKKFEFSLLFQFILSISALILTIVLYNQISFVNKNHLGNGDKSVLVLPEVPYVALEKYDTFKEVALKHPEILSISASTVPPGSIAPFKYGFEMEGIDNDKELRLTVLTIDEDFFTLFDIKPVAGNLKMGPTSTQEWERIAINPNLEIAGKSLKEFEASHAGFKEQYILNKAAVKMLGFSNPEDVIGREFKYNFTATYMFAKGEIIAVVDAIHYDNMFTKEEPIVMASKRLFNGTFFVKIDDQNKKTAVDVLLKEWNQLFPNEPLKYKFISDMYAKIYRNQYNEMKALTLFAILSIVLSTLGMFALSSFSIQHKTKEIGIKKANGATSSEILIQLIGEYTKWVALAFIIACPIAYYAASNWLSNFACKIELSWWIFALSGIIAFFIAIATVSWQTWRAASQDPVLALKYE
ncbi:ABC transporter permease [Labilibaculum manganireducens]|uniref:ABC transporter permease n=1 Tax=Labilibaculum manganireducens TaxID=1940525 RepID=UPI0029F58840|nr:ABC transporter permease [Labilibaculum manganireducens]